MLSSRRIQALAAVNDVAVRLMSSAAATTSSAIPEAGSDLPRKASSSSSPLPEGPPPRKPGPNGVPRYDFMSVNDRHSSLTHLSRPDYLGPFVYTNYVSQWPLSHRSFDYLSDSFGREPVVVEESERGGDYRDFYEPGWRPGQRHFEAGRELPLSELVSHIKAREGMGPAELAGGKTLYFAQQDVGQTAPWLLRFIRAPIPLSPLEGLFRKIVYRTNVWMGPKGTVTPLHKDPYQNFLCQVIGRKEVVLFHPSDAASLALFDPSSSPHLRNTSRLDLADPNILKENPGLAGLAWNHVILRSGEALYVPKGWFHYVRALEGSLSVNFWWNKDLHFKARRSA